MVLVVAFGAYYFGLKQGEKSGYTAGYEKGKEQGKIETEQSYKKLMEKAAVQTVSPVPTTNPLEGVKVNPFEGVYQNPFK